MVKTKDQAEAEASEEGMVEVIISFDPNDMSRNGTRDTVTASRAALLVNEGRARYADPVNAPPSQFLVQPDPALPET